MSECVTYLGQKGYSIYKDSISIKEQQWLRDELTVAPFIPKSVSNFMPNNKFPIYRESKGKFYIPRYFGENTFGEPNDVVNSVIFLCSDLSDYITGETIHVNGGMYFS